MMDLSIWEKPSSPVFIHCDNQDTIVRTKNKIYNEKSRHIHLCHNYVRQLVSDGIISMDYIRSEIES